MQAPQFTSQARRAARGFTMAELMAVVAIVGILATLATYSTRKYIFAAKGAEAIDMIANIKTAQEAYRIDTFGYLNVSTDFATTSYFPNNPTPGRAKMNFDGSGTTLADNWKMLGVQTAGPVTFVYATTAGANSAPTSLGSDISMTNWPGAISGPWYVVKARADFTGAGAYTVFATASFTGELAAVNN